MIASFLIRPMINRSKYSIISSCAGDTSYENCIVVQNRDRLSLVSASRRSFATFTAKILSGAAYPWKFKLMFHEETTRRQCFLIGSRSKVFAG